MSAGTSRRAARLTAAVVTALLVSGCGGRAGTSTAASTPSTTAPAPTAPPATLAPTTTGPGPLTAAELSWLKSVTRLHKQIDKPFMASMNMTRAKMVELGNALGTCTRELRRIGSPSTRLQPVYAAVQKACRIYDKGARCFATAARVSGVDGGVVAGTPEERIQKQAMDCGFAAQGNGGNVLADAEAKGEAIKAAAH